MKILSWFKKSRDQGARTDFDADVLPHWARVAFAARCARRALRFFRENDSDAPRRLLDTMENAIALAEQSAKNGTSAENAEEIVRRTLQVTCDSEQKSIVVSFAANAAQAVAAGPEKSNIWAWHNYEAMRKFSLDNSDTSMLTATLLDYQELVRLSTSENWTDETAVDPAMFD